ncbi:hypothetical protein IJ732_04510 [bacterium]|nr:hypothetical protein [bacterium]
MSENVTSTTNTEMTGATNPARDGVPTLFSRYYSWLTSSINLYNITIGLVVNNFSIFGESEVNPNIPQSKGIYVKALEVIAFGIIRTNSDDISLNYKEYVDYQINAFEALFGTKIERENPKFRKTYETLFELQDLDKDGRLGIKDLAVSLAYLDMQDGILNGRIRYEDAISLGEDINTESGRLKMKRDLIKLNRLLYGV